MHGKQKTLAIQKQAIEQNGHELIQQNVPKILPNIFEKHLPNVCQMVMPITFPNVWHTNFCQTL